MSLALYLFVLIEIIFVSIGDFKYRKIPNFWSIFHIGIYIVLLFLFPQEFYLASQTFIISTSFFVVGFILYLLKIMGGGDAKYLSTIVLLIPVGLQMKFVELLFLSTIIVASILFIKSIVKNFSEVIQALKAFHFQGAKNYFGSKFAYAPVILLAWIILGLELYTEIF